MLTLDHIAIGCTDLDAGVATIEAALGVSLAPGGQHVAFGTHNRLLGLGPELYLEVIAKDPTATPPGRSAWFGLDHFAGAPRPCNWICSVADIPAAAALLAEPVGQVVTVARDDLRWDITVPDDGHLPMGGAQPTLIAWGAGVVPPSARLPESGCRLHQWEVIHPKAPELAKQLPINDPRVVFVPGECPAFRAHIDTPNGRKVLS